MIRRPAILGGSPSFVDPVPIARPALSRYATPDFMGRIEEILNSGQVTNHTCVMDFEDRVASFLEVRSAAAVSSCTSGLILAMQLLGLGGKEVLIPTFTFAATLHAAYWNKCRIIFVDNDPETFNISIEHLKGKISKSTAGIVAVHVFGNPCEAGALEEIARERRLKLLFDAAHGFGASHKGRRMGSFGDAEVFSCSPTKILTTMEGGIVSTNDTELAQELRIARNYGVNPDYTCDVPGLSARMTEIGASLGREMLRDIDQMVENRNRYASIYHQYLHQVPGIGFQKVTPNAVHGFKDFALVIDPTEFGVNRDLLSVALEKEGISTKKYFSPLAHELTPYRCNPYYELPNARFLSTNVLCLPIYSYMDVGLVEAICSAIKRIHDHADEIAAVGAKCSLSPAPY